ncbi:MAG: MBL fold metallo-hydrolase [Sphingomonas sp.]
MTIQSWQVGRARITCILEKMIEPEVMVDVVPSLTPDALAEIGWLHPHYVDDAGQPISAVQAFIIEADGKRILVDSCIGDGKDLDALMPVWSRLQTNFLARLEAAGFAPDSIDMVVCTHLHADHIGWNTMRIDGHWLPAFPGARYLFGRQEFGSTDFSMPGEVGESPTLMPVYIESILPVIEAGLVDLVETDHQLCDSVRLVASPGHTPGHVSVLIESDGQSAMVSGDWVHHPAQLAHPEWPSRYDADPQQANATRAAMLQRMEADATLLVGSHFAEPSAGRVVTDGRSYRLATSE